MSFSNAERVPFIGVPERTWPHGGLSLEDAELAQRASSGDEAAWTCLVERYRAYVYTVAYRIVLHEEDAMDVSQNVFASLVRKIGQYDGRGRFRSWLATVTVREAISYLRRPQRRERPTDGAVLEMLIERQNPHEGEQARRLLECEQRRRLVESAMGGLSPQQRAIFALRLGEDIGPKEIGERLELPASQVRSQLSTAIARLRQALAGETV